MLKLYKELEDKWFAISEKLRYLLVGGFNTVAAYVIFTALYFLLRHVFGVVLLYGLTLIMQNVISINISIFTMRWFVFHSHGNLWKEYKRAARVYTAMGILNYVWLLASHWLFDMRAPIAQLIFLVFSTIATYILHKYFSFRKFPHDVPYT